jgi:hypothetical protein
MKCGICGNEMGKPLVFPNPVSKMVKEDGKWVEVFLHYMGGMDDEHERCWYHRFV